MICGLVCSNYLFSGLVVWFMVWGCVIYLWSGDMILFVVWFVVFICAMVYGLGLWYLCLVRFMFRVCDSGDVVWFVLWFMVWFVVWFMT